jgi:hypothetical protein
MNLSSGPPCKGSVITCLAVFLCACHEVREPVSKIDISEVRTADQLLSGFYQLEDGAWRWTARAFSAALKPPDGAEQRGATLELQFFIPDSQIESLGPMTLSANTDGHVLDPETFSKGGTYVYSRKIPSEALATSLLPVRFSFDKAKEPFIGDGRELAAIVSRIELHTD